MICNRWEWYLEVGIWDAATSAFDIDIMVWWGDGRSLSSPNHSWLTHVGSSDLMVLNQHPSRTEQICTIVIMYLISHFLHSHPILSLRWMCNKLTAMTTDDVYVFIQLNGGESATGKHWSSYHIIWPVAHSWLGQIWWFDGAYIGLCILSLQRAVPAYFTSGQYMYLLILQVSSICLHYNMY